MGMMDDRSDPVRCSIQGKRLEGVQMGVIPATLTMFYTALSVEDLGLASATIISFHTEWLQLRRVEDSESVNVNPGASFSNEGVCAKSWERRVKRDFFCAKVTRGAVLQPLTPGSNSARKLSLQRFTLNHSYEKNHWPPQWYTIVQFVSHCAQDSQKLQARPAVIDAGHSTVDTRARPDEDYERKKYEQLKWERHFGFLRKVGCAAKMFYATLL
jgi:hypothetical protein